MAVTTLKLGAIDPRTGVFGAHPLLGGPLDLNDGVTFTLASPEGLELPLPPRTLVPVGNIRTQGERATRAIFRHNREARARVILGPMTSATTLASALRTLLSWVNAAPTTPIAVQYQAPSASAAVYLDVVGAACDVPSDEDQWLTLQLEPITLVFWCRPGLRGDRITLQNLAPNPGFEQGSGPGVIAFSDSLATANAYSLQAGSAPGLDKSTYADAVQADAPLRFYRLDESSGTSCADAMGNGNGTLVGGVTLAQTGALTGDTDTAVSLNGTTGTISLPTTGLPTANAPWSIEAWIKLAANPTATAIIGYLGGGGSASNSAYFGILIGTAKPLLNIHGTLITAPSNISLNTWHHVVGTWDGTNGTIFVDGGQVVTGTATAGLIAYGTAYLGSLGGASNWLSGPLDEVAIYGTALSSTRIAAHYTAGTTTPATTANTLLLGSGGRISFGSATWSALNLWQLRMRYAPSLTATFYLHYTDANNYLAAQVTGTQLKLTQTIAGVATSLGTASLTLAPGARYWLQVTQFPTVPANPAMAQAILLADAGGTPGTALATLGPVPTLDAVTALTGAPQIAAASASLGLSAPHTVALFGP
ncbi:MAG: LamG domain-containing protein, partial [Ktedonobacterales bacterium]|nr:LamG domain-containing protein [Ktedonobacterales bacterium]